MLIKRGYSLRVLDHHKFFVMTFDETVLLLIVVNSYIYAKFVFQLLNIFGECVCNFGENDVEAVGMMVICLAFWCRQLVSSIGVVNWCRQLVSSIGVVNWCRQLVSSIGVVNWCQNLGQ